MSFGKRRARTGLALRSAPRAALPAGRVRPVCGGHCGGVVPPVCSGAGEQTYWLQVYTTLCRLAFLSGKARISISVFLTPALISTLILGLRAGEKLGLTEYDSAWGHPLGRKSLVDI